MTGVGIQRKYFFELYFDPVQRYHVSLGCRPLYDFEVHLVNSLDFSIAYDPDIQALWGAGNEVSKEGSLVWNGYGADMSIQEVEMYPGKCWLAFFLLFMTMSQSVSAAVSKCSFSKSVKQGRNSFDIRSRPGDGCAVQVITVIARVRGKNIDVLKADVDYLSKSAQVIDLNDDGTPELVVISQTTGGVATEALDVYWLDGTTLRRATVPELAEKDGYSGGDRYHLDGHKIVRTIPLDLEDNTAGKPKGGERLIMYNFREGNLNLYLQKEQTVTTSASPTGARTPQAAQKALIETAPVPSNISAPIISGITAGEMGLEIKGDGPIENYKVMKLEKPERIAIDIPGATSNLIGRKITINRFGISKARFGRNKGFLRIVLDTNLKTFPKYEVNSSGTDIVIKFTQ